MSLSLTFCLDVPVVGDPRLRLGLVPHLQLLVARLVVVLRSRGRRLEHPERQPESSIQFHQTLGNFGEQHYQNPNQVNFSQ